MDTLTSSESQSRDEARRQADSRAARLDEMMPSWFTRINLATLDMSSPSLCIAGQLDLQGFDWRWHSTSPRDQHGARTITKPEHLDEAWTRIVQRKLPGA